MHSDILQDLHDVGHYSRFRLWISFGGRNRTGILQGIAGFIAVLAAKMTYR